jgi:hypothetical protein
MEIHNRMDVIDSRDIVDRYNEIVGNPEFLDEATSLEKVIRQGENSSDWDHGETLIHESFFVEYTKDLIDDCYPEIREIQSHQGNRWPYRHIKIDYESAAEELKQDYTCIDFDGEPYYVRAIKP